MINLKSLEVFFWVAKLRSFSVAAEKAQRDPADSVAAHLRPLLSVVAPAG
ncbi:MULTISPECIES: hypothetical protein [Sinorhizobium]|nr:MULTISPECIES: hypothetical protein [Sinorhizobium]